MSSRYEGKRLKIQLFGQSHADAVGATIEGLPVGMELDFSALAAFTARRAPGKTELTTARREADEVEIISGLVSGRVCDAPLTLIIKNADVKSADYSERYSVPRPNHGDYPMLARFKDNADIRGGGHRSGRITAPLCAAGELAFQALKFEERNIAIGAHLYCVGTEYDTPFDPVSTDEATLTALASSAFPTLDSAAGDRMQSAILSAKDAGDSVGGIVEAAATGVSVGAGEPYFDSLDAVLARLFFALPGVKGFEMGAGFDCTHKLGSEVNDAFYYNEAGEVKTRTNNSGGVLGGRSSGMPIIVRAAFKPTPSIAKVQESVNLKTGESASISICGRHDPCIALRAVPCAEAIMAIALFDLI